MDFHEIYVYLKEILDEDIDEIMKKKLASSTASSATTTTGTTTTTTGTTTTTTGTTTTTTGTITTTTGTTTTTTGTVNELEKAEKYFQSKGLDIDVLKEELLVKEYRKQLQNKMELYTKEEIKKKKSESKIQLGK